MELARTGAEFPRCCDFPWKGDAHARCSLAKFFIPAHLYPSHLRGNRVRGGREVGFWAMDYDALPEPKRVFRAIWELEAQVNNGGFHQYFWNTSAWTVPGISDALRAIGATATAAIVNDAIAAVGRNVPWQDDEARREKLAASPDTVRQELEGLDQAFFRYPNDLTTLLYQYVCKHRNQIGAPVDF
jgi:Domain of unknown function (DUF4375)